MNDHTDILSKFPGPIVLSSRKKNLALCAMCLAFSVLLVAIGLLNDFSADVTSAMIFSSVAVLFISGVVLFAVLLLPGACVLTLDRDGFEATFAFRKKRVAWKDASDFRSFAMRGNSAVLFNEALAKPNWYARLNGALSGCNSGVQASYGLYADDQADLMSRWRERALRD
ncbi:MAG: hypothetical protein Q7T81_09085 [Pseudolabrys sp.]|nr:hypothetical protein [Pseudolabrys sp.]